MAIYGLRTKNRVEVIFLAPISVIIETYNSVGSYEVIEEAKKAFYKEQEIYTAYKYAQLTVISARKL